MTRADQVLSVIQDYWHTYVVPPTVRAVQNSTGISSTSVIRFYYRKLAESGAILLIKGKPVPVEIYKLIKDGCR
jgi:hypothetical protein